MKIISMHLSQLLDSSCAIGQSDFFKEQPHTNRKPSYMNQTKNKINQHNGSKSSCTAGKEAKRQCHLILPDLKNGKRVITLAPATDD
jgi:hypothetical protein